ncbi:hypothetical protein FQN54_000734 [Arachnomyces sp. PD_36]|nr:hypothetical protein FQN54_000734 [Arachnomyces sp. PD_36]
MATNGAVGRASSVASSSGASFVDSSGFKFSDKDLKSKKLKLKKQVLKNAKGKKDGQIESKEEPPGAQSPESSSPILPEMDEKTMAAFPTGKPREDPLESVVCKHCKKPVLKQIAREHIEGCLKAKQEKARKKKEARDAANRAKEKAAGRLVEDEDAPGEEDGAMKSHKGAKKNAIKGMAEDGPKKGKKRKADGEDEKDKEPKKKKKKDEPKPKVPKPKGPVDVEKQCGVNLPNGGQCARSLTCKSHSMGAKRAVPGRSLPYDMLLQAYQKKNQARQQKAAIDANAPLQDDYDNNGPIDSDEEKDAVMAAFTRSNPQPLVTHTLIPTRRKYQLVRMKEMLSHVLGGSKSGGIFGGGEIDGQGGQDLFQPTASTLDESPAVDVPMEDAPMLPPEGTKRPSISQPSSANRTAPSAAKKAPVAANA